MRTIERDIVGAFIFSNDDYLLLGKSGKGGVYKRQWVVPGGGIEKDETKLEAVVREVKEELGLDISKFEIKPLDGVGTGESTKTLRGNNEIVIVKMKFYDFEIRLPAKATDIVISLDDDLTEARWVGKDELTLIPLGGGTRQRLQGLGYL